MTLRTTTITLLLAALVASPTHAADDHKGHDHEEKGAKHQHQEKALHRGVVSVVKDINYELLAKPDTLALYISDHGQPVDLKGASAKVTLLSSSGRSEATLTPTGDRLEAKGNFRVMPGTKAVALVAMAGKSTTSVRFVLK